MSTPVSPSQLAKLNALITDGRGSRDQLQHLLENGDLLNILLNARDLSGVNRVSFSRLLRSRPNAGIEMWRESYWTPVIEYREKLAARSSLRGWGLTEQQLDALVARLPDHAGGLSPTGITLRLGRGIRYDWEEATAWLHDEMTAFGVPFSSTIAAKMAYFPRHTVRSSHVEVEPALLDLEAYWDRENGCSPHDVRQERDRWPGTEVAWLLALNPRATTTQKMGMGEVLPSMWAAGLTTRHGKVPFFHYSQKDEELHVFDTSGHRQWTGATVVAFRE